MKKLIILICLLYNTISHADIKDYDLFSLSMPMLCGLPETVDKFIKDNKFTAINISFGKENGKQDGEIVFAVKYYLNDKRQTIAVAEAPNDPYKCIMYVTFDMQMNSNLLGTDT